MSRNIKQDEGSAPLTVRNPQAFSLQDHQRIALLEGKLAADPDAEPQDLPETIIPLSHVQEERALRDEVTKAFHTAIAGDDEEDEDGFLVRREKTDTERDEDKEAYRRFLLANGGGEEQVRELLGLGGDEVDVEEEIEDDGMDVLEQEQKAATDVNRQGLERREKTSRQKKDDDAFLMK